MAPPDTDDAAGHPAAHRLAFVTIGQAPRDDLVPELLLLLGAMPGDIDIHQFGALDGLAASDIAGHLPRQREAALYTRLMDGTHVVVGAGFVAGRLAPLLQRLDGGGYDLIVLVTTGVFQRFRLHTPFVHGQHVVDAWIAALVMGEGELGLIYPLPQQHRGFGHGTLIQNARTVEASGETDRLDAAAARLDQAELIMMHSVGYTEAMTRAVAAQTRRPVVSARRIIASAIRLALGDLADRPAGTAHRPAAAQDSTTRTDDMLDRLPGTAGLTPRERDVLAAALDGAPNKEIARRLGISHRTVETHRARALAKLNVNTPTELMRRLIMSGGG